MVGDTPNLAARLQARGRAWAGGDRPKLTRQLLGDLFALRSLGPQTSRACPSRRRPSPCCGERALESRFAARQAGGVAPLVGRDQELALLLERWRQARGGEGQLVLLTGEAGIGKSRITEAVIEAVAAEPHSLIRYQCSPYHADSALHPAIQHLAHAAGFAAGDDAGARGWTGSRPCWPGPTGRRRREAAALLAALLGLDGTARYGRADPDAAAAPRSHAGRPGRPADRARRAPAGAVGGRGRALDRPHHPGADRAGAGPCRRAAPCWSWSPRGRPSRPPSPATRS